jgi:hypothetical protein
VEYGTKCLLCGRSAPGAVASRRCASPNGFDCGIDAGVRRTLNNVVVCNGD